MKEKAAQRIQARYDEAQKPIRKKQEKIDYDKRLIAETINTNGWKILETTFAKALASLKEQLVDTSPFRVLKCMNLKNIIKAFDRLHKIMLTAELGNEAAKFIKE